MVALLVHGRIAQRSVQIPQCLQPKSSGWCDLRRKNHDILNQYTSFLGQLRAMSHGVSLNFSTTPTTRSSWPMVQERGSQLMTPNGAN